jgi:hypothetical protein
MWSLDSCAAHRKHAGDFGELSGNLIVGPYAPQLPLLSRAAFTIFHGGPMIAIAVAFEQPRVGARLLRVQEKRFRFVTGRWIG